MKIKFIMSNYSIKSLIYINLKPCNQLRIPRRTNYLLNTKIRKIFSHNLKKKN